jgi:hypothetical protein
MGNPRQRDRRAGPHVAPEGSRHHCRWMDTTRGNVIAVPGRMSPLKDRDITAD